MKEKGFKQQKLGERKGWHDGMKFNSTGEEKGNYTSTISMKLQTVAEKAENTASTERDEGYI